MTTMFDPVTDETLAVAIALTLRAHQPKSSGEPRQCPQCREDGSCPQLEWALDERASMRERAAARLAAIAPPAGFGGAPTAG